jgi:hypothetical protein
MALSLGSEGETGNGRVVMERWLVGLPYHYLHAFMRYFI